MVFKEDNQPTLPRPSAAEIDRVYHDLATVLSDAGQDADGRRALRQDILRERLNSVGHSLPAIDWAVYLFCKDQLLSTTILEEKQVRAIRRGVNEVKARMINVPAVAATEAFWERWKADSFSPRQKEIILLIHGIRTFAWWQPMVKRVLEEIPNVEVWESDYGYFDVFRFWCPFFTRKAPIDEVRLELEKAMTAISKYSGGRLSVIAHSYGTYVITQILASKLDLKLHRLVLCGSIVQRTFPWHTLGDRIAAHDTHSGRRNILNDYGLRDTWPVFAKCLSWGYGDTGRHKFGKAEVIDRGHDLYHSGYFEDPGADPSLEPGEEFIRKFWKPWFEFGEVVSSDAKGHSPLWLSWLSILPLQWIFVAIIVGLLAWLLITRVNGQVPPTVPAKVTSEFKFDATTIVPPSEIEPKPIGEYAKTPDLNGFDITLDARLVDLRQLNDVSKSRSTTRHSPANFKRSVTLLRKSADTTEFVARYGTSGIGIDARCLSHPYSMRFAGVRPNSKQPNFLKNFELVVDVSKSPVDSPFTIDLEATAWNAFQGKEEWVGFDAYESTSVGKKVLTVLLPSRKPFSNLYIQATREGDDDVLPVPERMILRKDEFGLGFSWEVEDLPPDVFLETRWTW
ncbi:hypothetical protein M4951_06045 [Blastopirellula sp. J2-11]|uniref:hypothetical protein n=1 Tax=Blastopirellula sp. J2-11 TaxID=2943192 RepID=UPI0021C56B29|nr:hypothetical protein [Blastopirellula sp. J2-11]UUO07872.1 hypothetical protein M4951_06045 [Blastopirellula sp. J2-11]